MSLIINYEVREQVLIGMTATAAAARSFADGATTNGSPIVTSPALGAFTQGDVGRGISGAGIPAGALIDSVQSATQLTMTQNATATGAGVNLTIAAISAGPLAAGALTFRAVIAQLSPSDRIDRATVLANEATFTGYVAGTMTSWGEVFKDGLDNVFRNGQLLLFISHGTVSPPQTVYAIAWDDGVNCSVDFLTTPKTFQVDDDALPYLPVAAYGG